MGISTGPNLAAAMSLPTRRREEYVTFEEAFQASGVGLSSRGLVNWALDGGGDPATYHGFTPSDRSDLGRCERAYDAAPGWLADAMAPLLERFRAEVAHRAAVDARNAARAAEVPVAAAPDGPDVEVTLTAGERAVVLAALNSYADELSDYGNTVFADGLTGTALVATAETLIERIRTATPK